VASRSAPSLGQSGPLTGEQLSVRVNCKLALLGQDTVDVPPVAPQFSPIPGGEGHSCASGGLFHARLLCQVEKNRTFWVQPD